MSETVVLQSSKLFFMLVKKEIVCVFRCLLSEKGDCLCVQMFIELNRRLCVCLDVY